MEVGRSFRRIGSESRDRERSLSQLTLIRVKAEIESLGRFDLRRRTKLKEGAGLCDALERREFLAKDRRLPEEVGEE